MNRKEKSIKRFVFFVTIISIFITSCNRTSQKCNIETSDLITYSDENGEEMYYLFYKYAICDSLLIEDTIDMNFYTSSHEDIQNSFISFELPKGYQVNKIERITNFYASIWNDSQNVGQFLKLNNSKYTTKIDLPFLNKKKLKRKTDEKTSNNSRRASIKLRAAYKNLLNAKVLIFYPNLKSNYVIRKEFNRIKKQDLIEYINEEMRASKHLIEPEQYIPTKNAWLSFVKQYKPGEFLRYFGKFSVDYFEVYLKLSINFNGGNIDKFLKYNIHVGN
ncbi:MAG: hypothetical protein RIR12_288 [Bacteroidota bacterium]|jgi:hypothetical protein